MTDREKLIDLICESINDACLDGCNFYPEKKCPHCRYIADHLIANGVVISKNETTTQQWISVDDEKPKRRGHYFISYVFGCSDMRFYGEAMWHDDMEGNGYVTGPHFSNEGMDGMRVTHWMEIPRIPLSKPPKE